jgi:hypothetical protein
MPRALEVLDHTMRQLERGEIGALEAIDALLGEQLTLREGRRVKAALKMGRLVSIKTLVGFDFAFQPSLDRNRILALAQLEFIDHHEVLHFLGQPGCGKTHLAIALGVEAVKAGRGVYPTTQKAQINPGLSFRLDEKRGSRHWAGTTAHECRQVALMVTMLALYSPVPPMGGSRASCRRWDTRPAALGAWLGIAAIGGHSGAAAPSAGAAPPSRQPPRPRPRCQRPTPHNRAAFRGLAQPGFNEVAICVSSSAAGAARPRRTYGLSRCLFDFDGSLLGVKSEDDKVIARRDRKWEGSWKLRAMEKLLQIAT